MEYREARVYLDEVAKYGSVLGLENMRELLQRLGNPQDDLRFIHISGTNGKGSVLAYVSTVLKEAGYRVGRYISSTLFSYRERIQVNGEYIEKEPLVRLTGQIAEAAEGMAREGRAHPTAFEVETALGFLYFREKRCDIVVLETGLGGLEDATNVIKDDGDGDHHIHQHGSYGDSWKYPGRDRGEQGRDHKAPYSGRYGETVSGGDGGH